MTVGTFIGIFVAGFCYGLSLWWVHRMGLKEGFAKGFNRGYEACINDDVSPSAEPVLEDNPE